MKHPRRLLVPVSILILIVAFFFAKSHLETNLEIVSTLLGDTETNIKIRELDIELTERGLTLPSAADATNFFHFTFFFLALSLLGFAKAAQYCLHRPHLSDNVKRWEPWLVWMLLSMVSLVSVSYCTHMSLVDPLYQMGSYGQPFYTLSMEQLLDGGFSKLRTNPFVYPSLYIFFSIPFLFIIRPILRRAFVKESLGAATQKHQMFFGTLWMISLAIFLAMISGIIPPFLESLTPIELPKSLAIIAFAAFCANFLRHPNAKENVIGKGLLLLFLIPMLCLPFINDSGALLIVFFSSFFVFFSIFFKKKLASIGLVFYLFLYMLRKTIPLQGDRFHDWQLSDTFISSGRGLSHIMGTASSPDIAKAQWGIASGGLSGRNTAIFVDQLEKSEGSYIYSGIMSYGHNDRVASLLIETYGFWGFSFVLLLFFLLIFSLIELYRKSVTCSEQPNYGLAIGVASLFFGQVMVHIGGNFNFIPFTGIVLPFISHGGMSFLIYWLFLVLVFASFTNEKRIGDGGGRLITHQAMGMIRYMVVSFAMLLIYAFYMTFIGGPDYISRIRYDILEDLSIKQTHNPRLYLIDKKMTQKGQIVDVNGKSIFDGANYLSEEMNENDYFLRTFERKNESRLKGLSKEAIAKEEFYQYICYWNGEDYYQFAGRDPSSSLINLSNFFRNKKYSQNLNTEESIRYCILEQAKKGRFVVPLDIGIQAKAFGVPLGNGQRPEGCSSEADLQEEISFGQRQVLYFSQTLDELRTLPEDRRRPLMIKKVAPLFKEEYRAFQANSRGESTAKSCMVRYLHTEFEERKGIQGPDKGTCVVTNRSYEADKKYVYTADSITSSDSIMGYSFPIVTPISDVESIASIEIKPQNDNTCMVLIEHVGCKIEEGAILVNQSDIYLPETQDYEVLSTAVARQRVLFGNDRAFNRSLDPSDQSCKVVTDHIGEIQQRAGKTQAEKIIGTTPRKIYRLKSNHKNVVKLKDFIQSRFSKKQKWKKELEESIQQSVVTMNLNANLHQEVRAILREHLDRTKAPAIQAIVFETHTGKILSQAQHTRLREEYKTYERDGQFSKLYTDRGEYGYGRDTLRSSMTPGSVFKLYSALAAIDAQKGNFKHSCQGRGEVNGYRHPSWEEETKPIKCTNSKKSKNRSRKKRNQLNLQEAIAYSCNHYFSALVLEPGVHDYLGQLCSEQGLLFGGANQCALDQPNDKYPYTRMMALNAFGQGYVQMSVYEIARLLQTLSTNEASNLNFTDYLGEEKRPLESYGTYKPKSEDQMYDILEGMRKHNKAKEYSTQTRRVYGKTGTAQKKIQYRVHTKPRKNTLKISCPYYIKSAETCYRENLEEPYGVKSSSNVTLFVSLIERASYKESRVGTPRIGVVVRVPRNGLNGSAGSIAAPVAKAIINQVDKLDLIPE